MVHNSVILGAALHWHSLSWPKFSFWLVLLVILACISAGVSVLLWKKFVTVKRAKLVAAALAVLMILLAALWSERPAYAIYLLAVSAPITALALIDAKTYRRPNKLTYPLAAASILGVCIAGIVENDAPGILRAIGAAFLLMAAYFLQVVISWGKGMGLGDVKLSFSLGMILGYLSWMHVFLATAIAYIVAGLLGVVLLLARRATRKTAIPFGPFMVGGYWVALLLSHFLSHFPSSFLPHLA